MESGAYNFNIYMSGRRAIYDDDQNKHQIIERTKKKNNEKGTVDFEKKNMWKYVMKRAQSTQKNSSSTNTHTYISKIRLGNESTVKQPTEVNVLNRHAI